MKFNSQSWTVIKHFEDYPRLEAQVWALVDEDYPLDMILVPKIMHLSFHKYEGSETAYHWKLVNFDPNEQE